MYQQFISFAGPFTEPVSVLVTLEKITNNFAILSVPNIVGKCTQCSPGIIATNALPQIFYPTTTSQPMQFVQSYEEPGLFGTSQVRIDENGLIVIVSPFFSFPGLGEDGGVKAFTYLYQLQ